MMSQIFGKKRFLFVASLLLFFSSAFGDNEFKVCDSTPITWNAANITLDDGVNWIVADTNDVTVNVMTNDVTVNGNGANNAESQLVLRAEAGRTIRFNLTKNLKFVGSDNNLDSPLLIIISGPGDVIFNLSDGKKVSFTNDAITDSGPTKCYVWMDDGGIPTLCFKRNTISSDAHTWVEIGPDSLMGFASEESDLNTADDKGEIKFDPTNNKSNTGRMILDIQDCGAFIHTGRKVTKQNPQNITCNVGNVSLDYFICSDIDRTTAAGGEAIVKVLNSSGSSHHAGLLVLNRNCKLFDMLIDPFGNLEARGDGATFKGSFDGVQYGYVHGSNATLDVKDDAYFDYVGLCNNACPEIEDPELIPGFEAFPSKRVLKLRNPSAYWVDGNLNSEATAAHIKLGEQSGMFFRSGVDKNGDINEIDGHALPFTIDPDDETSCAGCTGCAGGAGEFVFIAEAPLTVWGSNIPGTQNSKIEIFSLYVKPTGGPLFAENCGGDQKNFPKRTFTRDCGKGVAPFCDPMCRYNKAAFLINDCVSFYDTSLVHTDVNHDVFEKNDLRSEPTYVGGEKWTIFDDELRPKFDFFGSRFNVHSDVAITGMDLRVPNRRNDLEECIDNTSMLFAYQNGRLVDNGTGRQIVLGTHIGSTTCDGCKIISRDAHLDVLQTEDCDAIYCDFKHELLLKNGLNTVCIDPDIEEVCPPLLSEFSVHNIFLGHSSNISIGTHIPGPDPDLPDDPYCQPDEPTPFTCETNPTMKIDGNFFAFSSRGGPLGQPSTTHLTGKGGIFVDKNGTFCIGPCYIATIGTMVTRSFNGQVVLPKEQVHFANHVGIADWRIDLRDEDQRVIVDADECFSDYTLNWIVTRKNFEAFYDKFCPYLIDFCDLCECPEVTEDNVSSLPTVEGKVGQFQIQASRIGDPAHLLVDGGHIRELVFLRTGHAGDASVANLVLRNDGRVGVGPAHPNPDTLFATATFGVNGITVIADGSGRIDLNEDMIINNRCAFVKGPNFVSTTFNPDGSVNEQGDVLEFTSDVPRTLLVKSTGILDLQSFGSGDTIGFGGQIRMIFEPGARVFMGGGVLQFANDAIVEIDPFVDAKKFFESIPLGDENPDLVFNENGRPSSGDHNPFDPLTDHGDGTSNTDSFRVKFIGTGTVQLVDDAKFYIDKDAYLGIETFTEEPFVEGSCQICITNLSFDLFDNSLLSLGGDRVEEGGSFQIGNSVERFCDCNEDGDSEDEGDLSHNIRFALRLLGVNAQFRMGPQAFFGMNVGVVDRRSDLPNEWLVDVLHNVRGITIEVADGLFEHADIFPGDSPRAHLLAIGQDKPAEQAKAEGAPNLPHYRWARERLVELQAFRDANANIHGGGNIVYLIRGAGAFKPIVLTDDDFVDVDPGAGVTFHPNMRVGLLKSGSMWELSNEEVTAEVLFEGGGVTEAGIKIKDLDDQPAPKERAAAAIETKEMSDITSELRVGFVDEDIITRASVFDLIGPPDSDDAAARQRAADRGAVRVLNSTIPTVKSVDM